MKQDPFIAELLKIVKPGDKFFISESGWRCFCGNVKSSYDCNDSYFATIIGNCLSFNFGRTNQYVPVYECRLDSSDSERVNKWNNLVENYHIARQLLDL
jgi:hypothetical protein